MPFVCRFDRLKTPITTKVIVIYSSGKKNKNKSKGNRQNSITSGAINGQNSNEPFNCTCAVIISVDFNSDLRS